MAEVMLTFLNPGATATISRVSGKAEQRQHLANLGFVVGAKITVVSQLAGNLILNVKDSRIAIDQGMARRIFVEEEME